MNTKNNQDISPFEVNEHFLFSVIREFGELETWSENIHRYLFIKHYCSGKRVLDLASGEGSGCNLLAGDSALVIGLEQDCRAVVNARNRYVTPNLSFLKASAFNLPFKQAEQFDVIVGFEVPEFAPDNAHLLDEVMPVLSDQGLFIVSFFNKERWISRPVPTTEDPTKNHLLDEFIALLRSRFSQVRIFSQETITGSSIRPLQGQPSANNCESCIRIDSGGITLSDYIPRNPFFFIVLATNSDVLESHSSRILHVSDQHRTSPVEIRTMNPVTTRLYYINQFLAMDVIHLYRYSVLLNNQIALLNSQLVDLQSTISYIFNRILDRRFPENTAVRGLIRYCSKIIRKWDSSDRRIQLLNVGEPKVPSSFRRSRRGFSMENVGEKHENKTRPVISLVLDGSNRDPLLIARSVLSIVAQTCPDWELLLVNGGKSNFIPAYDQRIRRIIHNSRDHVADVLSPAISGTHVCFIAAGDILAPKSIHKIIEFLKKSPDTDILYTDEFEANQDGIPTVGIYRPDYSEDFFLTSGYISRFITIKRNLIPWNHISSLDSKFLPFLFLHAKKVEHIPIPLYYSNNTHEVKIEERMDFVSRYLVEKGVDAEVTRTNNKGVIRIRRKIIGAPKVSIIIPTRDQMIILKRCIDSIKQKSTFGNFEIIVVNNQSRNPETIHYLRNLIEDDSRFRVVDYPFEFNYSSVNNFAAGIATGDHLLFLNNDIEVISPEWIEALLEHSQRDEVACVGAKLLYPDGTIQHAGVVIGLFGGADHIGKHIPGDSPGYLNSFVSTRDYSAVTSACMMIAMDKFKKLGGFDENFIVGFGDTDLCLRAIAEGYRNIFTPYAVLYHHESSTRGQSPDKDPHPGDTFIFQHRWRTYIEYGDPYYNPNLPIDSWEYQP